MQTPRLILIAGAVLVLGSVSLACEISAPIWFPDGDADPLYRIVRGNYAGYIDGTGRVVIPPKFADTENNLGDEFHNGRLAVREIEQGRSGYRYVDLRGNVVSTSFSFAEQFSEGLALVRPTWNGPYGYIDVDGRVVIPPRFEQADSFSNGMAAIHSGERTGYIGRDGVIVIPPRYFRGRAFHEDRTWVVLEGPCRLQHDFDTEGFSFKCLDTPTLPASRVRDQSISASCTYALIDKSGQVLSSARFAAVGDFSEGLSPVKVGQRWGYVNRSGVVVIEPRFDFAFGFSEGLAAVAIQGPDGRQKYGFINRSGAFVIQPQFIRANPFSEGMAAVWDGDKYWFVDREGRRAINRSFEAAGSFFKGLAHVKTLPGVPGHYLNGTFAYIDRTGKSVFTYTRQRQR